MTTSRRSGLVGGLAMGAALVFSAGCQTSSHKSVQTYDYREEPPQGRRTVQPVEEAQPDEGDWQMVAPGQMVVQPD